MDVIVLLRGHASPSDVTCHVYLHQRRRGQEGAAWDGAGLVLRSYIPKSSRACALQVLRGKKNKNQASSLKNALKGHFIRTGSGVASVETDQTSRPGCVLVLAPQVSSASEPSHGREHSWDFKAALARTIIYNQPLL